MIFVRLKGLKLNKRQIMLFFITLVKVTNAELSIGILVSPSLRKIGIKM